MASGTEGRGCLHTRKARQHEKRVSPQISCSSGAAFNHSVQLHARAWSLACLFPEATSCRCPGSLQLAANQDLCSCLSKAGCATHETYERPAAGAVALVADCYSLVLASASISVFPVSNGYHSFSVTVVRGPPLRSDHFPVMQYGYPQEAAFANLRVTACMLTTNQGGSKYALYSQFSISSACRVAIHHVFVEAQIGPQNLRSYPGPSRHLGCAVDNHSTACMPAAPGRLTVAVQTASHACHGSLRCGQLRVDDGYNRRRPPQSSKGLQASFLSR